MQESMIVWLVVGGIAGLAVGWLIAQGRAQGARAVAATQLATRDAEVARLHEEAAAKDRAMEEKSRE